MQYIESGRRDVASQRDPPGQKSVYIPPSTFTLFHNHLSQSLLCCFISSFCYLLVWQLTLSNDVLQKKQDKQTGQIAHNIEFANEFQNKQ